MDLATLRQQILSSSKAADAKAEDFLLERKVNDLSKDEWRELIAGFPEDVKKEIGRLKSAGTQLHLHICLIVRGHQLALQHDLVSQWPQRMASLLYISGALLAGNFSVP